ncbi:MAG: hypothetical protein IJQ80_05290 [Clostridia bacterium]|nr:hypothetical protein [Clostridia bacterium]
MIFEETKEALSSIALGRENEYRDRLAELAPENKTEIKALKVLINIARLCSDLIEKDHEVREAQLRNIRMFDEYLPALETLEEEDRKSFVVFAAAVSMVYCNFYAPARAAAEESAAGADEVFVAKLKYGATREILEKWIAWWNANGCVACEVAL